MEENKYLVVWNEDWADEFNTFGFEIILESDLNKIREYLSNNLTEEFKFGFGTNESHEFTAKYLLYRLGINNQLITNTEAEVIEKFFGSYGNRITFCDNLLDRINYPDEY